MSTIWESLRNFTGLGKLDFWAIDQQTGPKSSSFPEVQPRPRATRGRPSESGAEGTTLTPSLAALVSNRGSYKACSCRYSQMGKPFEKIFLSFKPHLQEITKKFDTEPLTLQLKFSNLGYPNSTLLEPILKGKFKTFEHCNPYFELGPTNDIGVQTTYGEYITNKFGIKRSSRGSDKDHSAETVYDVVRFEHPSVVCDTKMEVTRYNQPSQMGFNWSTSCVLGHTIRNFNLMAGVDLAKTDVFRLNTDWKRICRSVSLAMATSNTALKLTVQPYEQLYSLNGFWKINDKFETAGCLQSNFNSPTLSNPENQLGLKYNHTDNVSYAVKTDFGGNVSLGAWMKYENMNISIFTMSNFMRNFGLIDNVGFSIEF